MQKVKAVSSHNEKWKGQTLKEIITQGKNIITKKKNTCWQRKPCRQAWMQRNIAWNSCSNLLSIQKFTNNY